MTKNPLFALMDPDQNGLKGLPKVVRFQLMVVLASLCAAAGFSRYFVTPSGFNVGDSSDWAALAAFIIMAVVVGELASRAERRASEAQAGRQNIFITD